MKRENIYHILKVFCFIIFACFLLTACAGEEHNGQFATSQDCEENGVCQDALAHNICWQRSVLEVVYSDLGAMTTRVYKTITDEHPGSIMVLAFIIWMAWQILKHVANPSSEAMGEFWTKILRQAALCLVCGILVSDSENIIYAINTFVFPVYITFLEYTSEVLKSLGNSEAARATSFSFQWDQFVNKLKDNETIEGAEKICTAYVHKINDDKCIINNPKAILMKIDSFPKEPLDMIGCMSCAISDRLSVGYAIAMRLFLKVGILSFLSGLFLIVAFTIAKFTFAIYFIDSIFRFDMMLIIMPFLIMFYPFKQTRKWCIQAFKIIINSSVIIMCVGLIMAMSVFAMQSLLMNKDLGFSLFDLHSYQNFGVVPMAMVLMGFMIVKATSVGMELGNRISGYSNTPLFQRKMQSLLAPIGSAIRRIAVRFVSAAISKGVSQFKKWASKNQSKASSAQDGASEDEE